MKDIRLVVFDMAGTIVDHGCFAPVVAFVEAFAQMGVTLTDPQARGPMGLHKRDHIRALFQLPEITYQWQEKYQRAWTEKDVEHIYTTFVPLQKRIAAEYTELIPGVLDCVAALRSAGIAVATSTGYPREVTEPVLQSIAEQGFQPDHTVCADEVPSGRPAPWMIFRCMEALDVFPSSTVVKVGDTIPDIEAARNAGVVAIGVTESSSDFGLSVEQLLELSASERADRSTAIESKLRQAGAHHTITSVANLAGVILSK